MPEHAQIRPLREDDADPICDFLDRIGGFEGTRESVRQLITWQWPPHDKPKGIVIDDGRNIVGFIGMVFSHFPRHAADNGESGMVVGTFSFYHVDPAHRSLSIPMLSASLKHCDAWAALTPNETSQAILTRLKFRRFTTGFHFHTPSPLRGLFARRWSVDRVSPGDSLPESWRTLVSDHEPLGCSSFVIDGGDTQALVITKSRQAGQGRVRLRASEILYCSAPQVLQDAWMRVSTPIVLSDRTVLVAVDDVFDPAGKIPGGRARERIRMCRGFPEETPPDALYSELVLLY